jgi:hypothetical protein
MDLYSLNRAKNAGQPILPLDQTEGCPIFGPPRTLDAVKRMEAGADFDELQYVADLMNLVSQELGKRKP